MASRGFSRGLVKMTSYTPSTTHHFYLSIAYDQALGVGARDKAVDALFDLTKGLLSQFQAYVREHARPCGKCWKAFLGGN